MYIWQFVTLGQIVAKQVAGGGQNVDVAIAAGLKGQ
jgi:hypothetical protein